MDIFYIAVYLIGFVNSIKSQSVCSQHKTIFSSQTEGFISEGSGNYKSNQRCEWLIQSPNKTSHPFISLEFSPTTTECGYDFIVAHDGDSDKSPILATLSGDIRASMQDKKVVASSGQLLLQLFSDKNTEKEGFNATFRIYPCINNCSGKGHCKDNICVCDVGFVGDDCSQESCPRISDSHGQCRHDTKYKKNKCSPGYIGKGCDISLNGDNDRNSWFPVYDYSGEHGSEARAGHAGCYVAPYYYIFGGYDLTRALSHLLRFNFAMNEWLLLEPSTRPGPRYYHTMSAIVSDMTAYLFLFGGQLENEDLSAETWLYDTTNSIWTKHMSSSTHSSPPPLCQHAATVVNFDGKQFVYVYGGRSSDSRDFGLSSDMYRFDFNERRWEKVKYDRSGVSSGFRLQAAGHSMVYDSRGRSLVVFGGFRMDDQRKAALSSSVFLYSVSYNRWSEVTPSTKSWSYDIEPLGFHTANVVGDYMIVHGGKKNGHLENRCFSRQTHFYSLRSRSWIRHMSKNAASSPAKLFGHAADVIDDKILIVHGGYYGMMSGVMRAYSIPNLNRTDTGGCDKIEDEDSCRGSFVEDCVWRRGSCENDGDDDFTNGAVCSSLKDCLSCTTHGSYSYNSTLGWEKNDCVWCVQDDQCYSPLEKDASRCGFIKRRNDGKPWWRSDEISILKSPKQCMIHDIRPGAVMMEYNDIYDRSRPDHAHRLKRAFVEWKDPRNHGKKVVKIQGLLKVHHIKKNYVHLQLGAVKGNSSIRMNRSTHPRPVDVIVKLNDTDTYAAVQSDPIPNNYFQDQGRYIEMTFSHSRTDRWNGKMQVGIRFSDSTSYGRDFLPLTYAYLEQYRSSVQFGLPPCSTLKNCLSCLSDASCAWCSQRHECMKKSTLSEQTNNLCARSTTAISYPWTGVVLDLEFCAKCSDHMTCDECVNEQSCGWDEDTGQCMRGTRKDDLTTELSKCPVLCSKYEDCESCMSSDSRDWATPGCSWCVMKQICYRSTRHHLPAYPFGECAFWVDRKEECPVCSKHYDCVSCLETYGCGWCSDTKNPLIGYCTKGNFFNPSVTCNAAFLPNATNPVEEFVWSYSSCPDVDECVLQEWPRGNPLNRCHKNARCINTYGSYKCECRRGFAGNGFDCEKSCFANCGNGTCSGPPTFECVCNLGYTSTDSDSESVCDVDCGCNYLSVCSSGPGNCDLCQFNSTGHDCGECVTGFYHAPDKSACWPCECNGHGISAFGLCDQDTGTCFCQDHTKGKHCENCEIGYYGNPRDGGACYRTCDGRLEIRESTGFIGSWMPPGNAGSMLRLKNDDVVRNCEWTIVPDTPGVIKITFEKNSSLPCHSDRVQVYEGDRRSDSFDIIGEVCGTGWSDDVTILATSGSATIRFAAIFQHGQHASTGFSAKFDTLRECFPGNQSLETSKLQSVKYAPDGHFNFSAVSDCPRFSETQNGLENEWTQNHALGNFSSFRIGSVAVALQSSIWVHGGVGLGRAFGDLWKYDVATHEWRQFDLKFCPSPRYYHSAASDVGKGSFTVYGGVTENLQVSSELWKFSENSGWELYQNNPLPALAGHTMTSCDGVMYLIIGGYNTSGQFSNEVWTLDINRMQAKLRKIQGYMTGIYGHSAVCDKQSSKIYIFGGVRDVVRNIPQPSDILYRLDTESWNVEPVFKMRELKTNPAWFQAAFHYYDARVSGMITLVGDATSGDMMSEMWFYHYAYRVWIKISSDVCVRSLSSSSVALVSNKTYIFGGVKSEKMSNSLIAMSDIDLCPSVTTNIDGSRFCYGSTDGCVSFFKACNATFSANLPRDIEMKYIPSCSLYRDCKACNGVTDDTSSTPRKLCRWCQADQGIESLCVSAFVDCDNSTREVKGCDPCDGFTYSQCVSKSRDCVWSMVNEPARDRYYQTIKRCKCQSAPSSDTSKWAKSYDVATDACPRDCNVFNDCKSCLENGIRGTRRGCTWVERKKRCVDSRDVYLVCPVGGDCGILSDGGKATCPKRCEDMRYCGECTRQVDCFWVERDGTGVCRNVAQSQNKTGRKWYFECPLENECFQGWDNCVTELHEACQDMDKGYRCVCEKGYDRESPTETCKPVCSQGCIHGKCISPGRCRCAFGYAGDSCNVTCNCNGHSECVVEKNLQKCLLCHNNTFGETCSTCAAGYVGNPTKAEPCVECKTHCNGRSDNCVMIGGFGFLDSARCVNCTGNSRGDRCEKCRKGYFNLNERCEKCQCNGHSDQCDEKTGGFCKCQNNTMSSDERCNGVRPPRLKSTALWQSGDKVECWKKQCDRCKPSYIGNPADGGHCYGQMYKDHEVCLDWRAVPRCPYEGAQARHVFPDHILEYGRRTQYYIVPKFTNLDIKLIVDVGAGKLTVFLCSEMVQITHTYARTEPQTVACEGYLAARSKRDITGSHTENRMDLSGSEPTNGSHAASQTSKAKHVKVRASSDINTYVTFEPGTALEITDVENRLIVVVPQDKFDLKMNRFFVVLISQNAKIAWKDYDSTMTWHPEPEFYAEEKRYGAAAKFVFRQDQTNMDLFVFFSTFFSCFVLALSAAMICLKIKDALNVQRAHREQSFRMQHMAKRPFATVNIMFDERKFYAKPAMKKTGTSRCELQFNVSTLIESAPVENATTSFSIVPTSLNFRTKIVCKQPVTVFHREQDSGMIDIPLLNSTAKYNPRKADGVQNHPETSRVASVSKRVSFKQPATFGSILQRGHSSRRFKASGGVDRYRVKEPSIIACETTKSNLCVPTVLLQLPGSRRTPISLSLGSTLLSTLKENS